jgi:hypothetical protein
VIPPAYPNFPSIADLASPDEGVSICDHVVPQHVVALFCHYLSGNHAPQMGSFGHFLVRADCRPCRCSAVIVILAKAAAQHSKYKSCLHITRDVRFGNQLWRGGESACGGKSVETCLRHLSEKTGEDQFRATLIIRCPCHGSVPGFQQNHTCQVCYRVPPRRRLVKLVVGRQNSIGRAGNQVAMTPRT